MEPRMVITMIHWVGMSGAVEQSGVSHAQTPEEKSHFEKSPAQSPGHEEPAQNEKSARGEKPSRRRYQSPEEGTRMRI